MNSRWIRQHCSALTMVELLVVIAVIGMLIFLTLTALGSVRNAADRTAAVGNMRQIGLGIQQYAGENANALPGPLWPGQIPILKPDRDGRLVRELAPYLQIPIPPSPEVIELFVPPAYRKKMGGDFVQENARTYVMNMFVPVEGSGMMNPWGTLTEENSTPARLMAVDSSTWAFSDADQLHPRVAGAPWRSSTPPEPVHGHRRLAWYFDGRVERVDVEELNVPAMN